jgi:hypothetical protein
VGLKIICDNALLSSHPQEKTMANKRTGMAAPELLLKELDAAIRELRGAAHLVCDLSHRLTLLRQGSITIESPVYGH